MTTTVLKNYVNGEWVDSSGTPIEVENPATGEAIARVLLSTASEADDAIEAARAAFKTWKKEPVAKRTSYLFDLLSVIKDHEEEIVRALVRENGKSLPDGRAEMKRTIENIETACGMPVLQQGDRVIGCSDGIDGEVIYEPKGVFTMIAPFNFPAMVPFWFLPYAIASGNTYVLKPSEQVPITMTMIADLIDSIGLPDGVFNLVNGDRTVAERCILHPEVAGVSVVGSSTTAESVRVSAAEHGKRIQAMGGAKNHLIVMPDAQIDQVIRNMITSCYGCAGQRCMAASAIVCVGKDTYKLVTEQFIEASKSVVVANPLDPTVEDVPVVMGPVISATALERIGRMIETGISEAADLRLDGRGISVSGSEGGHYLGPSVFTDVPRDSTVHRTEIFGPVVVMLRADDLDDAIDIINSGEYGNGASIYTQDGYSARKFKVEVEAGMVGINVGIPAPVAYLPFGGMKSSLLTDVKSQGKSVIRFFTEEKIVTERYWPPSG